MGTPTTTDAFRLTVDPSLTYYDWKGNRHKVQMRYLQVDNDNTNNQGNFSKYYYAEYRYQRRFEEAQFTVSAGAVGNYNTVTADLYADIITEQG